MRGMEFPNAFVGLVMKCVSSVSFSFFINGRTVGLVCPTRGLLHEDPLSPYLFLLVTEKLSALIQQACNSGLLHGIQICQTALAISHLFFVDIVLYFFRATREEASNLKTIRVPMKSCLATN